MKTYQTIVFIVCILINCCSCQRPFNEDVIPAAGDTAINSSFKAIINGTSFVAEIYGATIRPDDSIISISAKDSKMRMIVLTVKDSGVHVYTLATYSTLNFGGYTDENSLAYASNEGIKPSDSGGTLTITSLNKIRHIISGTFYFKAFRQDSRTQRTISDGVFTDIPF